MISHGGLSTTQEVTQRAVPVLGVPAFCDQGYNIRRLTDLGVAQTLPATELNTHSLHTKLKHMIRNIQGSLFSYCFMLSIYGFADNGPECQISSN